MASTGSVSSWDEALLTAMIQYPVLVITGPEDIQIQVDKILEKLGYYFPGSVATLCIPSRSKPRAGLGRSTDAP